MNQCEQQQGPRSKDQGAFACPLYKINTRPRNLSGYSAVYCNVANSSTVQCNTEGAQCKLQLQLYDNALALTLAMPQLSKLGQHASSSSLRQANVRLWSDSSVMGRAAGQFRLVDLCSMQSVAYSHRREEATGPRAKCMHATVCTNLGSNGSQLQGPGALHEAALTHCIHPT